MNILFVARATLYSGYGGDTVQIVSTAKYLQRLGVIVDIKLSGEYIDYNKYALIHFFNIIRPADIMAHTSRSGLPYVVSTIFLDLSESQKRGKGIRALLSKYFSADQMEYLKAIARWIRNGERIQDLSYIYLGHKKAVKKVAKGAAYLLPNSENEHKRFVARYGTQRPYKVIYNGIDEETFDIKNGAVPIRDSKQVLCVARFETNKNQMNLIKALNNTPYRLKLVGKTAPNHVAYYNACKAMAADNVVFEEFVPSEQLVKEYRSARVHVLPSWNETCGLSSLEAAYNGCNIVITNKGDTVEYFGRDAWYCDPDNPASIYEAIVAASQAPFDDQLCMKIGTTYNWQQAAADTLSVYEKVLNKKHREHHTPVKQAGINAEKIKSGSVKEIL